MLPQAGWHISDQLKLPEGLDLYFLPAYSPELQPAERNWPLTNEVEANESPQSIEDKRRVVNVSLSKIIGATRFGQGINLLSLVANDKSSLIQLFIRT